MRRVHQRDESVLVSVEFLDVRITDRQHLLAACFELQREMMHKGEEDN